MKIQDALDLHLKEEASRIIGDAEETEYHLQVALLVFHGLTSFAGRVHAATGRCHDHRLALGQAFGALGRVLEGSAGLSQAVNPGLELGRNAEVIERCANHDHVRCQELAHQLLGHDVFTLLCFAQPIGLTGAWCHRIHGEVSGCVSRQVEVADFDVGVLSQVGLHDLRCDFARDGVGAGDGRVDV